MRRFILTAILFVCLLKGAALHAQAGSGLWDGLKQNKAKAAKAASGAANSVKKFRDHLQQWGLDTAYCHGLAIGGRVTSTGWTGLLIYQKRISRTQNQFYQLSFSEIKGEKQVKQQRDNTAFPELGASSPFVFGKINNAYTLQLGHGREFLLLPGVLEGNITVSLRAQAGLSLALLKPYYLKLIYVDYNPDAQARVVEEKYGDANRDKFLNTGYILGASKWGKGLDELTCLPGGYVGLELVIEPLKNRTFIKTVTLGTTFALHSGRLEIMADQPVRPWTACVYAGLSLGKRWR